MISICDSLVNLIIYSEIAPYFDYQLLGDRIKLMFRQHGWYALKLNWLMTNHYIIAHQRSEQLGLLKWCRIILITLKIVIHLSQSKFTTAVDHNILTFHIMLIQYCH